jgi:hypothetical protein
VTDDPPETGHAENDPFRVKPEALQWRAERTRLELEAMSDLELIAEVSLVPAPHIRNPMELDRRLKESIRELRAEMTAFRTSADRQARWLLTFTVVLVILTIALVIVAFTGH